MKTFGIYLAFPADVDLRSEGLGRYIAGFLNAAKGRSDARFVIACPNWMIKSLHELLEKAGVAADAFEIISPTTEPSIPWPSRTYQIWQRGTAAKRYIIRVVAYSAALLGRQIGRAEKILTPSLGGFAGRISRSVSFRLENLANRLTLRPASNMDEAETKLLCDQINSRKEIVAWYAPTAFWPHFNGIETPRLTCVPDIVVHDFPVAFSSFNDDRFLEGLKALATTIAGGDRFVTYSDDIKYRTLVDRYRIAPDAIAVVPHGVNRLDDLIAVSGFADNKTATDLFCRNLFGAALHKAINTTNPAHFDGGGVQFLFYATQFRPNKNIISLLRAYEYLLRRRYIGHKLVLTGNPNSLPEIAQFIRVRGLQNDVLCLHGLSSQELAACYRLADLAVNPSLSEGGCPFTLTEALSVGTPVVMARIAVTEEVVTDPRLQEIMLFDPYDWEDMAARIEWALNNRDFLLERQLKLYEKLAERSWTTVVGEYIAILDRISNHGPLIEDTA